MGDTIKEFDQLKLSMKTVTKELHHRKAALVISGKECMLYAISAWGQL